MSLMMKNVNGVWGQDLKIIVHILCYMDTIDETWVKEALEGYDPAKITWKDFNIKL